jgi:hypothetical protein
MITHFQASYRHIRCVLIMYEQRMTELFLAPSLSRLPIQFWVIIAVPFDCTNAVRRQIRAELAWLGYIEIKHCKSARGLCVNGVMSCTITQSSYTLLRESTGGLHEF